MNSRAFVKHACVRETCMIWCKQVRVCEPGQEGLAVEAGRQARLLETAVGCHRQPVREQSQEHLVEFGGLE
jgi:hypothetical protein